MDKDLKAGASEQPVRFDLTAALAITGDDEDLLKELAGLFLQEYPQYLMNLRAAVEAKDPHAIERSAHFLKGSVANFGAIAASEAAFRLESKGRNRDLSDLEPNLAAFEAALEPLLECFRGMWK